MADVFISFSSKDFERVSQLHDAFAARDIDVWWMKDISPGDSTIHVVSAELEKARRVVLAWSRHSANSPYVEGEIMHAFGTRKLIPVRIEPWAWPAFLSSVQFIDLPAEADIESVVDEIEARLTGVPTASTEQELVSINSQSFLIPRSAGPVFSLSAIITALALLYAGLLSVSFHALENGDERLLDMLYVGLSAFPVLALLPLGMSTFQLWRVWRARPKGQST